MSFKAKDLQFDNSQPAFLRRLRGELTSGDSARHEQPVARNKRLKQDDEDDAPTYVLEDTKESLTKEEYEALVSGKDSSSKEKDRQDDETTNTELPEAKTKPKDKIAEVGTASKKRKAAKIISDEQDATKDATTGAKGEIAKGSKKAKKKAKAVKLTFGDEE